MGWERGQMHGMAMTAPSTPSFMPAKQFAESAADSSLSIDKAWRAVCGRFKIDSQNFGNAEDVLGGAEQCRGFFHISL